MMRNALLTIVYTVLFSIVKAQNVPSVSSYVSAVTELPTVAVSVSIPSVITIKPTVHSIEKPFYEQIPLVSNVVSFAKKHLRTRYRSGGTTTRGFDCSGFTRFCFNQFGIVLPHSSAAQGSVGQAIAKFDAQPGDLILFKGHRAGDSRVGHVGLITDVVGNRIQFIHSAWNGGVRYDYLHADYYQRRFMGVRRVVHLLAEK